MPAPSRKKKGSRGLPSERDGWNKLLHTAKKLEALGHLDRVQTGRVRDVVALLSRMETSPKRKKYKQFFYEVHSRCGPAFVLVGAIAWSQGEIVDTSQRVLKDLLGRIERNRNQWASVSIIYELATQLRVPLSSNGMASEFPSRVIYLTEILMLLPRRTSKEVVSPD